MASETASKSAMEHGLKTVEVTVKDGPGRESAIRITISWFRSNSNQRRYSVPQRLSSTKTSSRIILLIVIVTNH